MLCASSQATLVAANSCAFSSRRFFLKHQRVNKRSNGLFTVRASSDDDDCNEEECAPEKEVSSNKYFSLLSFFILVQMNVVLMILPFLLILTFENFRNIIEFFFSNLFIYLPYKIIYSLIKK